MVISAIKERDPPAWVSSLDHTSPKHRALSPGTDENPLLDPAFPILAISVEVTGGASW